jgi:hypothetical protein
MAGEQEEERGSDASDLQEGPPQVAWLLNIRGADVPYNPVAIAYCVGAPTGAVPAAAAFCSLLQPPAALQQLLLGIQAISHGRSRNRSWAAC